MRRHPLFGELELALAAFVPPEPVALEGAWTRSIRRTYANAAQSGTGSGPFVDVLDLRWGGSLSSLHAYERDQSGVATFAAGVADSFLPGVPTSGGYDLAAVPIPGPSQFMTGRVTQLAATTEVSFHVLVLQRPLVIVGRKRLWRLRDELASALPDHVRQLLTRRRSGSFKVSQ